MLREKNILIGITGSIAAYKAAMLVRILIKNGAHVKVVMTPLAKQFITPLTMATLSKNPILVDFFDPENGQWNSHVSLGEWADAYIIAPATANTMAKMSCGIADNLLLTTYLSARCPVFIAPAMDLDMFTHPATTQNLATLSARGVKIVEPGSGELASGLDGKGRMAEPEEIVRVLTDHFQKKKTLEGKRILVTAGPTVEPIDPVRFISNHSTGKMGYAIADELSARGAHVTLITGPTAIQAGPRVERIDVTTAEEMYRKSTEYFNDADGAVMCAAVADYTPEDVSRVKIKKRGHTIELKLKKTEDIAASLGRVKGYRILAGFALETDSEVDNARGKLLSKNLDFIVLNSLRDKGAGFGGDTNKITILDSAGCSKEYPLMEKREAAAVIADRLEEEFSNRR